MTAKKRQNKTEHKTKLRFLGWFWGIFTFVVLLLVMVFVAIAKGWIGYMPPIEELQNPKNKFATEIFSSDGELIGTIFTAKDNSVNAEYSELAARQTGKQVRNLFSPHFTH